MSCGKGRGLVWYSGGAWRSVGRVHRPIGKRTWLKTHNIMLPNGIPFVHKKTLYRQWWNATSTSGFHAKLTVYRVFCGGCSCDGGDMGDSRRMPLCHTWYICMYSSDADLEQLLYGWMCVFLIFSCKHPIDGRQRCIASDRVSHYTFISLHFLHYLFMIDVSACFFILLITTFA